MRGDLVGDIQLHMLLKAKKPLYRARCKRKQQYIYWRVYFCRLLKLLRLLFLFAMGEIKWFLLSMPVGLAVGVALCGCVLQYKLLVFNYARETVPSEKAK